MRALPEKRPLVYVGRDWDRDEAVAWVTWRDSWPPPRRVRWAFKVFRFAAKVLGLGPLAVREYRAMTSAGQGGTKR